MQQQRPGRLGEVGAPALLVRGELLRVALQDQAMAVARELLDVRPDDGLLVRTLQLDQLAPLVPGWAS